MLTPKYISLEEIYDIVAKSKEFYLLKEEILSPKGTVFTSGIIPPALPLLIGGIDKILPKKKRFLILTAKENIHHYNNFLSFYNSGEVVHLFSLEDINHFIHEIYKKKEDFTNSPIYLVNIELFEYLHKKKIHSPLRLHLDDTYSKEELINYFISMNYKYVTQVELIGEYTTRGCIVDVFSLGSYYPLRIELDGDKIVSLRLFSPETQRSISLLSDFFIFPNIEVGEEVSDEKNFTNSLNELFSFLSCEDIVFILPSGIQPSFISLLKSYKIWQLMELEPQNNSSEIKPIKFSFHPITPLAGSSELIRYYFEKWQIEDFKIIIGLGKEEALEVRIKEVLKKNNLDAYLFFKGDLEDSFAESRLRVVFISPNELLGYKKPAKKTLYSRPRKKAHSISILDLKEGDYVVHENHGIGIYRGIKKLTVQGIKRDYILIEYANDDKLYLPPEYIYLLEIYLSSNENPPLNKLGDTNAWSKLKSKVKEEAKELANQLLKTEAIRKTLPGFSFITPPSYLKEVEDSFPYEETEDQLSAIQDVYKDMESTSVMERLICGDVGFGKTEVALRAAYKAVLSGKQIAFLVPTTVLAQQQFNNLKDRLEPLGVSLGLLSRLQKDKERKAIINGLKENKIDIVVGTHRLLQEDVKFYDLGLVVIDEEHRFGVRQKEHLRKLYPTVDVLYLSATPIPRTLYLALSNLRDISLIYTPPPSRLPIKTYVMPFSWNIVKEAIEKELLRGGQIFYLHNHIPTLPIVERKLRELLPQLTLRVAHGSLDREELSSVMLDFLRGEFSLLLATTIIESGLDLPNVNTLIVSGAHKFGLAQLYQIRGRIGRRDKLAYAYLLHPPNLDTEKYKKAKSRLEALKEFSSIGSSLRLAIKDLQMRGCGELLGKRQHGNIKAVGLNLYSKLLKEAREEVAREYNLNSVKDEKDKFSTPIIEPFFDAYIDEFYLPQDVLRFQIYKRLINIKNIQELSEFEEELKDRFGNKLPKGLKQLLILAQLRCQAASAGIDRVYLEEGSELLDNRKRVIISLKEAQNLANKLIILAKKFSSRITFFQQEPKISLYYDSKGELMFLLKEIFDTLKT